MSNSLRLLAISLYCIVPVLALCQRSMPLHRNSCACMCMRSSLPPRLMWGTYATHFNPNLSLLNTRSPITTLSCVFRIRQRRAVGRPRTQRLVTLTQHIRATVKSPNRILLMRFEVFRGCQGLHPKIQPFRTLTQQRPAGRGSLQPALWVPLVLLPVSEIRRRLVSEGRACGVQVAESVEQRHAKHLEEPHLVRACRAPTGNIRQPFCGEY